MARILRGPLIGLAALALAGCAPGAAPTAALPSLTPGQRAQLFCVVSAEGVVIAEAVTKGGAQATAESAGALQPVACDAAVKVGQALTPAAKP
jgi:hypothetical protein